MAYKEWDKRYNVAVKQFNDDHKKLIGYLNELHRGLTAGIGISDMGYILKGLIDYTTTHFKNEEKLMKKHHYPEFEQHKVEHDKLLEDVSVFYDSFIEGKKAFSLELLSFLNDWVSNHILRTDMKYKPFFKKIAEIQKES